MTKLSDYKGAQIEKVDLIADPESAQVYYRADYTNKITGFIITLEDYTLIGLKQQIDNYHAAPANDDGRKIGFEVIA